MTLAQIFPPTVLITRPQPQAGRLGDWLTGQGVQVVLSPLMRLTFPDVALPQGPFASVILTSEAGALAATRLQRDLPDRAYCVGERTAEAARKAGFDAHALGATAEEMLIALAAEQGPFLCLRGHDATTDIAARLSARGQTAAAAVMYDQQAQPLSDEALALLCGPGDVVVPLYSTRSARLFLAARPQESRARLHLCLIAPAILQALPPDLQDRAIIATQPDGPAMRAAILRVIRSLVP